MSGHSKWASIKHKKALVDAKRGKLFTKLIREITVAARSGGGRPENSPRLRLAIATARASNMPQDNIERAVKKGTGELEGVHYEEVSYEGYGPGGTAILVDCLTDNKNRTASEVRTIFSRNGGNLAGAGSVAWQFESRGLFVIGGHAAREDQLLDVVLAGGAEDMSQDKDTESFEVTCKPEDYDSVRRVLEEAHIPCESQELTKLPKNLVQVESAEAKAVMHLLEALENYDDVQHVYSNVDIPKDLLL